MIGSFYTIYPDLLYTHNFLFVNYKPRFFKKFPIFNFLFSIFNYLPHSLPDNSFALFVKIFYFFYHCPQYFRYSPEIVDCI